MSIQPLTSQVAKLSFRRRDFAKVEGSEIDKEMVEHVAEAGVDESARTQVMAYCHFPKLKIANPSAVSVFSEGVEDVGKQTRSDPMETVRPGTSPSESPEVSWRETKKMSLSHEAKQARYT